MKRTELQELAYKTIPESEKNTRLSYRRSIRNWLVKKILLSSDKLVIDPLEFWWFIRELDTIDYPWCKKYEPQKVRLGYKGEEHYLLICKTQNGEGSRKNNLWMIENMLSLNWYTVELHWRDKMSAPWVFHIHVWK